jgi:hypothetical protein
MKDSKDWGPADYQAMGGVLALLVLAVVYILSRF